ncbi:centrosomal protein of 63 kDa-like isoform X3 [Scyliorhinus canicula]|uniref:centrosomal protein of 63 kDa-like isoform X3 n=1 Tax=Scyliorhinus canicula TaxID=7830 RepID=UPI0018F7B70D|nr:centrosomal protein of 63 kDa-like isoform X3 [Scyliorhinus canicula]
MEEIIKGLEKNCRLRGDSCEAELQELMHQIDVMVNRKKVEWEQHSQSLETRLEMREVELANVRTCLDQKHHEVGNLRQQLEDFENSHREVIRKYEERLKSFKSDLHKLRCSYEKLQKHQLKQDRKACEFQITGENGETNSKQYRVNSNFEKMESDISELQIELQSRDDLLQVTDMEQKQLHKELARVKESIMHKDSVIRLLEQSSPILVTGKLANLEVEYKSSLKHLQESSKNEAILQSEIMRLNAELDLSHAYCMQQSDQLDKKEEELQRLQNEYMEGNKEINQLRDRLCQKELSHSSEMMGIRTEVSNLTTELDQKEITIATATQKTAHLEKQLKTELEKREQILAEYWVAMDQLGPLELENKQLKKILQTLEGKRSKIEDNQVKELQNAYVASVNKLGYDNKQLQKDLVKLRAELEMSSKASQEKYEAALRHTQQVVAEMKGHEDRRVKKLRQENEQQMSTMKTKLDETIQHYEGKIKNLQKGYSIQNNLRGSAPEFAGTACRECSLERKPTTTELSADNSFSYWHSNDIASEPFTDVYIPNISLTSIHPQESFLLPKPKEMSETSSLTEHFLEEEEERARVLEELLNSHIDELQTDSKHTIKMYAGATVDVPDTTALLCQCSCQET